MTKVPEGVKLTMPARKQHLSRIRQIFRTLEAAMGPQHWWPADSAFEVVLGAYLTQNTAWTNVERAMQNLRAAGALSLEGIRRTPLPELEQLIRPAGYFRQKAARVKRFVEHLDANHGGSLEALFATPLPELRDELLRLPGIGPETADSILLYAGAREVFVVDAYTRRIFERHALAGPATAYDEIRTAVEQALTAEDEPSTSAATLPILTHQPSTASRMSRSELARRYNEFHALIVQTAKHFCVKTDPRCEGCPLRPLLPRERR